MDWIVVIAWRLKGFPGRGSSDGTAEEANYCCSSAFRIPERGEDGRKTTVDAFLISHSFRST